MARRSRVRGDLDYCEKCDTMYCCRCGHDCACGTEWGDLDYCEECDTMYCCRCGHDCDFNDLYDADELGLDPEDDDARKYGSGDSGA